MSPNRKKRLDEIGFVWIVEEKNWEENYNRLVKFKKSRVTVLYLESTKMMDLILEAGLALKRSNKSTMHPNHKKRLNDIGFVWNILTSAWEKSFEKLLQFYEREGHCFVPERHKEGTYHLGSWVQAKEK